MVPPSGTSLRRRCGRGAKGQLGERAPPYLATGDLDATLAGFLAIGITLAGALAFAWRWWPAYVVVAAAVAWVLLLAPDAYAAFGVLFLLTALTLLAAALRRGLWPSQTQAGGHPAVVSG